MTPKFKVGDRIVKNGNEEGSYYFKGYSEGKAKEGDEFIISAVGDYGNGNNIYSVEGAYTQQPNWSSMEENFDLAKVNSWKKRLTK